MENAITIDAIGDSTADAETVVHPRQVDRYRIERLLGRGAFGSVYLAHDDQLQRLVGLKIPHRRLVASANDSDAYLAEARTAAGLDHPNIVPVYDVGQTQGMMLICWPACAKRSKSPNDSLKDPVQACKVKVRSALSGNPLDDRVWSRFSAFMRFPFLQPLLTCVAISTALAGCGTEPFGQPVLPLLNSADPVTIRQAFPRLIPDEFTSDDTLVIQFPFNIEFAMLGVLNVNRSAGTFEFYALNQAGIQYFHLAGDRKGVAVRDAIGPWMEHRDILLSIARDIQHAYFDLAPGPDSNSVVKRDEIVYNQPTPHGTLIYEFGLQPTVALQKEMSGFFGTAWRARYYEYRAGDGGKLFPHGIVMDNFQSHYRLIIKNRDWTVDENK